VLIFVDTLRAHLSFISKVKFNFQCHSYGIQQEFSSPITQQNGVVERKNRVIQKMAQVMIHSKSLAQHF
jgi:hypothetical protein